MVGFIFFLRFGRVFTVIATTWQFLTLTAVLIFFLIDTAFLDVTATFSCVFQPEHLAFYLSAPLTICRVILTIRTYGTATTYLLFHGHFLLIRFSVGTHCTLHHG